MIWNPDFKEFVQSLNDNEVRYLVVGGYAVALHGHPRYTKDLDIWLWLDRENALQVIAALQHFGFGSLGLTPEDFLTADQIVQLGYPPNHSARQSRSSQAVSDRFSIVSQTWIQRSFTPPRQNSVAM